MNISARVSKLEAALKPKRAFQMYLFTRYQWEAMSIEERAGLSGLVIISSIPRPKD